MKFLNSLLPKITSLAISVLIFGASSQPMSLTKNVSFQEKINNARNSFENVYYELLKQNFFGIDYINNLVFNSSLNYDFVKHGRTCLTLIDWLEKQNDLDSRFLLKKMNKFFCLQFHKHLCDISISDKDKGPLWSSFHSLYRHTCNSDKRIAHPFRSSLTKIILFIFIMDFSHFDHQAKEEGLVYGLEKVKRDMFAINKTLGFDAIDTLIISKFIEKIQLYGIEKSLVTPGNMRRIIFWGILGLGSLALTGYIVFDVIPRWDTLWDKWRENLTNTADKAVEKVVETFFDVAEKRAQSDKFKKLIETLSDTAVGSVYKAGSERVSETKNNIVRPFVDNPLVNGIGNIVNGVKEYFSSNTNTDGTPPEDTNREQKKATMPPYKGRD